MSARSMRRMAAALAAGTIAFLLYHRTLVPGMDLGDSASFEVDAGTTLLTPRQGYPLYFALTRLALIAFGGEPAHAVNVMSAAFGAAAVALLTVFVAALVESAAAGLFAGLLCAVSYTFWSQSVTAEVYTLHLTCVALTLIALRAWGARPSRGRLAIVFAIYALSFGNHLSMILFAPAIALFIAMAHPRRWRGLIEPATLALAAAMAVAGATQYVWNIRGMLAMPDVPHGADVLRAFWFDVTKTDWRQSMVLGTPRVMFGDRLAMYWFDLRQQFGVPGAVLALAGAVALLRKSPCDFVLLSVAFAVNWMFAFTYNVGDVHVFFLPSHFIIAIVATAGASWLARSMAIRSRLVAVVATAVAFAWIGWRAYDDFPALDRHADRRGEDVVARLTTGLSSDRAIFAADLNWQLQNGLSYYGRYRNADLVYFRATARMLGLPLLVESNEEIGRRLYLTSDAARRVTAAYGSMYEIEPDPAVAAPRLADVVRGLPAGTPYVLSILTPYRDRPIDPDGLQATLTALIGGSSDPVSLDGYSVIAGVQGTAPTVRQTSSAPFRVSTELNGLRILVRMDSWLAYDTIRRADFGHVIVNHQHALAIDRGVSFVAWPPGRDPLVAYESSLYAPQPRYLLK